MTDTPETVTLPAAEVAILRRIAEVHRWSIERDGADLLVCENNHERSEPCEVVRYTPADDVARLRAIESAARVCVESEGELWYDIKAALAGDAPTDPRDERIRVLEEALGEALPWVPAMYPTLRAKIRAALGGGQ
jgi:hypothetical protein